MKVRVKTHIGAIATFSKEKAIYMRDTHGYEILDEIEEDDTLESLQLKYTELIGELPPRYKNNVEWIKSKLEAHV